MVMTPDTRPSRPTRDPETDPRPFFESPSQSRRSDAQPRSRCSLLLVLFPSSLSPPLVVEAVQLQRTTRDVRSAARKEREESWCNGTIHTKETGEIRGTMVSARTVLDLRTLLRSLEVNPLWGIMLTAPVDPSTRKRVSIGLSRELHRSKPLLPPLVARFPCFSFELRFRKRFSKF